MSTLNIKKLADYKKIASQVKMGKVEVTEEEISRLRAEKERIEKERVRREIIEQISEQSEADIPQDLIDKEKNAILENLKQQVAQMLQISFQEYLKRINKTESELVDSLTPEAKKRLMTFLILRAVAENENVHVHDEEIQREMEVILKNFPNTQNIDKEQLKEYTKETLRNEKVFQLLENL